MSTHVKGTIARIHVSDGPVDSWPIAERAMRGWQSGVMFYPDAKVVEVTDLYVRVGPTGRKLAALAQREVLAWLDEHGVDAEQLDMALEVFCEPNGVTYRWPERPAGGFEGDNTKGTNR